MNGKINIGSLIDRMIEMNTTEAEYYHSSAVYFRKNHHGVWLDRAMTPEEKHIAYYSHYVDQMNTCYYTLVEVLDLNRDQAERLGKAARAMTRWYEKETQWEKLPSEELLDRIGKYIFG